jgi:hypothetical protein
MSVPRTFRQVGGTYVECFVVRRVATIVPRLFGQATLTVARTESHAYGLWDEGYDYESPDAAFEALGEWILSGEPEPQGWHRHVPSSRRRPAGDSRREHVRR